MRAWQRLTGSACAGAALFVACVVPDIELVEQLPNGAAGGSAGRGGGNVGGNKAGGGATPGEGGDPSGAAGERAMGGGAATGGDAVNGGSAGTSGSAGTGGRAGSGPGGEFPPTSACDSVSAETFCETFPSAAPDNSWNVSSADIHDTTEAPSLPAYVTTSFKELAPAYKLTGDVKLSFWVLFEQQTNQAFVSIGDANGEPWEFGMNGDRFRFHHGGVGSDVVAPTSNANTLLAQTGVWTCVELMRVGSSLSARVVPFKKAPVDLPAIDGQPTAGEDEAWVNAVPEPDWDESFFFGNAGNSIALDDVMVGALDEPSVCDFYLTESQ